MHVRYSSKGGKTFVRALEALGARSLLGRSRNGNIRLHKAEPRLKINVEMCRSCPSYDVARASCLETFVPIQTRYIARGCPLLDVIGHPLTSTTDGKSIGRWLPSSLSTVNACKVREGCREVRVITTFS